MSDSQQQGPRPKGAAGAAASSEGSGSKRLSSSKRVSSSSSNRSNQAGNSTGSSPITRQSSGSASRHLSNSRGSSSSSNSRASRSSSRSSRQHTAVTRSKILPRDKPTVQEAATSEVCSSLRAAAAAAPSAVACCSLTSFRRSLRTASLSGGGATAKARQQGIRVAAFAGADASTAADLVAAAAADSVAAAAAKCEAVASESSVAVGDGEDPLAASGAAAVGAASTPPLACTPLSAAGPRVSSAAAAAPSADTAALLLSAAAAATGAATAALPAAAPAEATGSARRESVSGKSGGGSGVSTPLLLLPQGSGCCRSSSSNSGNADERESGEGRADVVAGAAPPPATAAGCSLSCCSTTCTGTPDGSPSAAVAAGRKQQQQQREAAHCTAISAALACQTADDVEDGSSKSSSSSSVDSVRDAHPEEEEEGQEPQQLLRAAAGHHGVAKGTSGAGGGAGAAGTAENRVHLPAGTDVSRKVSNAAATKEQQEEDYLAEAGGAGTATAKTGRNAAGRRGEAEAAAALAGAWDDAAVPGSQQLPRQRRDEDARTAASEAAATVTAAAAAAGVEVEGEKDEATQEAGTGRSAALCAALCDFLSTSLNKGSSAGRGGGGRAAAGVAGAVATESYSAAVKAAVAALLKPAAGAASQAAVQHEGEPRHQQLQQQQDGQQKHQAAHGEQQGRRDQQQKQQQQENEEGAGLPSAVGLRSAEEAAAAASGEQKNDAAAEGERAAEKKKSDEMQQQVDNISALAAAAAGSSPYSLLVSRFVENNGVEPLGAAAAADPHAAALAYALAAGATGAAAAQQEGETQLQPQQPQQNQDGRIPLVGRRVSNALSAASFSSSAAAGAGRTTVAAASGTAGGGAAAPGGDLVVPRDGFSQQQQQASLIAAATAAYQAAGDAATFRGLSKQLLAAEQECQGLLAAAAAAAGPGNSSSNRNGNHGSLSKPGVGSKCGNSSGGSVWGGGAAGGGGGAAACRVKGAAEGRKFPLQLQQQRSMQQPQHHRLSYVRSTQQLPAVAVTFRQAAAAGQAVSIGNNRPSYHAEKQEWRTRYYQDGRRCMRTYSAKYYGFERAKRLAECFNYYVQTRGTLPTQDELLLLAAEEPGAAAAGGAADTSTSRNASSHNNSGGAGKHKTTTGLAGVFPAGLTRPRRSVPAAAAARAAAAAASSSLPCSLSLSSSSGGPETCARGSGDGRAPGAAAAAAEGKLQQQQLMAMSQRSNSSSKRGCVSETEQMQCAAALTALQRRDRRGDATRGNCSSSGSSVGGRSVGRGGVDEKHSGTNRSVAATAFGSGSATVAASFGGRLYHRNGSNKEAATAELLPQHFFPAAAAEQLLQQHQHMATAQAASASAAINTAAANGGACWMPAMPQPLAPATDSSGDLAAAATAAGLPAAPSAFLDRRSRALHGSSLDSSTQTLLQLQLLQQQHERLFISDVEGDIGAFPTGTGAASAAGLSRCWADAAASTLMASTPPAAGKGKDLYVLNPGGGSECVWPPVLLQRQQTQQQGCGRADSAGAASAATLGWIGSSSSSCDSCCSAPAALLHGGRILGRASPGAAVQQQEQVEQPQLSNGNQNHAAVAAAGAFAATAAAAVAAAAAGGERDSAASTQQLQQLLLQLQQQLTTLRQHYGWTLRDIQESWLRTANLAAAATGLSGGGQQQQQAGADLAAAGKEGNRGVAPAAGAPVGEGDGLLPSALLQEPVSRTSSSSREQRDSSSSSSTSNYSSSCCTNTSSSDSSLLVSSSWRTTRRSDTASSCCVATGSSERLAGAHKVTPAAAGDLGAPGPYNASSVDAERETTEQRKEPQQELVGQKETQVLQLPRDALSTQEDIEGMRSHSKPSSSYSSSKSTTARQEGASGADEEENQQANATAEALQKFLAACAADYQEDSLSAQAFSGAVCTSQQQQIETQLHQQLRAQQLLLQEEEGRCELQGQQQQQRVEAERLDRELRSHVEGQLRPSEKGAVHAATPVEAAVGAGAGYTTGQARQQGLLDDAAAAPASAGSTEVDAARDEQKQQEQTDGAAGAEAADEEQAAMDGLSRSLRESEQLLGISRGCVSSASVYVGGLLHALQDLRQLLLQKQLLHYTRRRRRKRRRSSIRGRGGEERHARYAELASEEDTAATKNEEEYDRERGKLEEENPPAEEGAQEQKTEKDVEVPVLTQRVSDGEITKAQQQQSMGEGTAILSLHSGAENEEAGSGQPQQQTESTSQPGAAAGAVHSTGALGEVVRPCGKAEGRSSSADSSIRGGSSRSSSVGGGSSTAGRRSGSGSGAGSSSGSSAESKSSSRWGSARGGKPRGGDGSAEEEKKQASFRQRRTKVRAYGALLPASAAAAGCGGCGSLKDAGQCTDKATKREKVLQGLRRRSSFLSATADSSSSRSSSRSSKARKRSTGSVCSSFCASSWSSASDVGDGCGGHASVPAPRRSSERSRATRSNRNKSYFSSDSINSSTAAHVYMAKVELHAKSLQRLAAASSWSLLAAFTSLVDKQVPSQERDMQKQEQQQQQPLQQHEHLRQAQQGQKGQWQQVDKEEEGEEEQCQQQARQRQQCSDAELVSGDTKRGVAASAAEPAAARAGDAAVAAGGIWAGEGGKNFSMCRRGKGDFTGEEDEQSCFPKKKMREGRRWRRLSAREREVGGLQRAADIACDAGDGGEIEVEEEEEEETAIRALLKALEQQTAAGAGFSIAALQRHFPSSSRVNNTSRDGAALRDSSLRSGRLSHVEELAKNEQGRRRELDDALGGAAAPAPVVGKEEETETERAAALRSATKAQVAQVCELATAAATTEEEGGEGAGEPSISIRSSSRDSSSLSASSTQITCASAEDVPSLKERAAESETPEDPAAAEVSSSRREEREVKSSSTQQQQQVDSSTSSIQKRPTESAAAAAEVVDGEYRIHPKGENRACSLSRTPQQQQQEKQQEDQGQQQRRETAALSLAVEPALPDEFLKQARRSLQQQGKLQHLRGPESQQQVLQQDARSEYPVHEQEHAEGVFLRPVQNKIRTGGWHRDHQQHEVHSRAAAVRLGAISACAAHLFRKNIRLLLQVVSAVKETSFCEEDRRARKRLKKDLRSARATVAAVPTTRLKTGTDASPGETKRRRATTGTADAVAGAERSEEQNKNGRKSSESAFVTAEGNVGDKETGDLLCCPAGGSASAGNPTSSLCKYSFALMAVDAAQVSESSGNPPVAAVGDGLASSSCRSSSSHSTQEDEGGTIKRVANRVEDFTSAAEDTAQRKETKSEVNGASASLMGEDQSIGKQGPASSESSHKWQQQQQQQDLSNVTGGSVECERRENRESATSRGEKGEGTSSTAAPGPAAESVLFTEAGGTRSRRSSIASAGGGGGGGQGDMAALLLSATQLSPASSAATESTAFSCGGAGASQGSAAALTEDSDAKTSAEEEDGDKRERIRCSRRKRKRSTRGFRLAGEKATADDIHVKQRDEGLGVVVAGTDWEEESFAQVSSLHAIIKALKRRSKLLDGFAQQSLSCFSECQRTMLEYLAHLRRQQNRGEKNEKKKLEKCSSGTRTTAEAQEAAADTDRNCGDAARAASVAAFKGGEENLTEPLSQLEGRTQRQGGAGGTPQELLQSAVAGAAPRLLAHPVSRTNQNGTASFQQGEETCKVAERQQNSVVAAEEEVNAATCLRDMMQWCYEAAKTLETLAEKKKSDPQDQRTPRRAGEEREEQHRLLGEDRKNLPAAAPPQQQHKEDAFSWKQQLAQLPASSRQAAAAVVDSCVDCAFKNVKKTIVSSETLGTEKRKCEGFGVSTAGGAGGSEELFLAVPGLSEGRWNAALLGGERGKEKTARGRGGGPPSEERRSAGLFAGGSETAKALPVADGEESCDRLQELLQSLLEMCGSTSDGKGNEEKEGDRAEAL